MTTVKDYLQNNYYLKFTSPNPKCLRPINDIITTTDILISCLAQTVFLAVSYAITSALILRAPEGVSKVIPNALKWGVAVGFILKMAVANPGFRDWCVIQIQISKNKGMIDSLPLFRFQCEPHFLLEEWKDFMTLRVISNAEGIKSAIKSFVKEQAVFALLRYVLLSPKNTARLWAFHVGVSLGMSLGSYAVYAYRSLAASKMPEAKYDQR